MKTKKSYGMSVIETIEIYYRVEPITLTADEITDGLRDGLLEQCEGCIVDREGNTVALTHRLDRQSETDFCQWSVDNIVGGLTC